MPVRTLNSPAAAVADHWKGEGSKLGGGTSSTAEAMPTKEEQDNGQDAAPQRVPAPRKLVVSKIIVEGKRINSVTPTATTLRAGNIIIGSSNYKPDLGNGADAEQHELADVQVESIHVSIQALNAFAPVASDMILGNIAIEAQLQPKRA